MIRRLLLLVAAVAAAFFAGALTQANWYTED